MTKKKNPKKRNKRQVDWPEVDVRSLEVENPLAEEEHVEPKPEGPNDRLAKKALMMEPGDWFDIEVPRTRPLMSEFERLKKFLYRRVTSNLDASYRLRTRLTASRKIQVICERRAPE